MAEELEEEGSCILKFRIDEELEHFTRLAVEETERWIEAVTKKQFKYPDDPRKSLENGVLLCEMLNCLRPGSVKKINRLPGPIAGLDNLNVFHRACREEFGLKENHLFDPCDLEDLSNRAIADSEESLKYEYDRRLRNVLVTIFWLGKANRDSSSPQLDLKAFSEVLVGQSANRQVASPLHSRQGSSSLSDRTVSPVHSQQSSSSSYSNSAKNKFHADLETDTPVIKHTLQGSSSSSAYESCTSDDRKDSLGTSLSEISHHKDLSFDSVLSSDDPPGSADMALQENHRFQGQAGKGSSPNSSFDGELRLNESSSSQEDPERFGYRRGSHGSHDRTSSTDSLDRTASPEGGSRRDPNYFNKLIQGPQALAKDAQKTIEVLAEQKQLRQDIRNDENDWQSNLSSWKSKMRRKSSSSVRRALEAEEVEKEREMEDASKRKAKTFKEMMADKEKRVSSYSVYPFTEDDDTFSSASKSKTEGTTTSTSFSDATLDKLGVKTKAKVKVTSPIVEEPVVEQIAPWAASDSDSEQPKSSTNRKHIPSTDPVVSSYNSSDKDTSNKKAPGKLKHNWERTEKNNNDVFSSNRTEGKTFGRSQISLPDKKGPSKNTAAKVAMFEKQERESKEIPDISSRRVGKLPSWSAEEKKHEEHKMFPIKSRKEKSELKFYGVQKQNSADKRLSETYGSKADSNFKERKDGGLRTFGVFATNDEVQDYNGFSSGVDSKESDIRPVSPDARKDEPEVYKFPDSDRGPLSPKSSKAPKFVEKFIKITQDPSSAKGFGFSIKGGKEFSSPIIVDKVTMGSAADVCEVMTGDEILSVNGAEVSHHYLESVQLVINQAHRNGQIELKVRRQQDNDFSLNDTLEEEQLLSSSMRKTLSIASPMERDFTDSPFTTSTVTAEQDSRAVHHKSTYSSSTKEEKLVLPNKSSTKQESKPAAPLSSSAAEDSKEPTLPWLIEKKSDTSYKPLGISKFSLGPKPYVPPSSLSMPDKGTKQEATAQASRPDESQLKAAASLESLDDEPPPLPTAPPPEPNWNTFPDAAPPGEDLSFIENVLPDNNKRQSTESKQQTQLSEEDAALQMKEDILRKKSQFFGISPDKSEELKEIKADKAKEKERKSKEESLWQKIETKETYSLSNSRAFLQNEPQPREPDKISPFSSQPSWQAEPQTEGSSAKPWYEEEEVPPSSFKTKSEYDLEEQERKIIADLERSEAEKKWGELEKGDGSRFVDNTRRDNHAPGSYRAFDLEDEKFRMRQWQEDQEKKLQEEHGMSLEQEKFKRETEQLKLQYEEDQKKSEEAALVRKKQEEELLEKEQAYQRELDQLQREQEQEWSRKERQWRRQEEDLARQSKEQEKEKERRRQAGVQYPWMKDAMNSDGILKDEWKYYDPGKERQRLQEEVTVPPRDQVVLPARATVKIPESSERSADRYGRTTDSTQGYSQPSQYGHRPEQPAYTISQVQPQADPTAKYSEQPVQESSRYVDYMSPHKSEYSQRNTQTRPHKASSDEKVVYIESEQSISRADEYSKGRSLNSSQADLPKKRDALVIKRKPLLKSDVMGGAGDETFFNKPVERPKYGPSNDKVVMRQKSPNKEDTYRRHSYAVDSRNPALTMPLKDTKHSKDDTEPLTREDVLALNRRITRSMRDRSPEPEPYKPTDITDIMKPMSKKGLQTLEATPRSGLKSGDSWINRDDGPKSRSDRPRRSEIMRQNISHPSQHWVVEEAERRRLADQAGKERLQKLQNRQNISRREGAAYNATPQQRAYDSRQTSGADYLYNYKASSSDNIYQGRGLAMEGFNTSLSKSVPQVGESSAYKPYGDSYEPGYRRREQTVGRKDSRPLSEPNLESGLDRLSASRSNEPPYVSNPYQPSVSQMPSFVQPSSQMQHSHAMYPSQSSSYNPQYSGPNHKHYPSQDSGYYDRPPVTHSHSSSMPYGSYSQAKQYYTKENGGYHQHPDLHRKGPTYLLDDDNGPPVPAKPPRLNDVPKNPSFAEQVVVSGRQRCAHCEQELGQGAAMIIESLGLYYHVQCFRCCVCHTSLGTGQMGADVRVRVSKLHCYNCYSNDEGNAGPPSQLD